MGTPQGNAKMKFGEAVSEVRVACISCAGQTRHRVVKSITQFDELQAGDRHRPPMLSFHTFELIQCMGCERPGYRETDLYDFYLDQDEMGIPDQRLYPPRLEDRKRMNGWSKLPDKVRQIYNETYLAISGDQPILSSIGIRTIVETVCNDRGIRGRNLCRKIDGLVAEGDLTQEQARPLHLLREMGNEATHEALSQGLQVFGAAFDVIEHLLRNLYIVPDSVTRITDSRIST